MRLLNLAAGSAGSKEEAATSTHRAYSPGLDTAAGFSMEENAAADKNRREEESATNPRLLTRAFTPSSCSIHRGKEEGRGGEGGRCRCVAMLRSRLDQATPASGE
jgi:hypothetical protein